MTTTKPNASDAPIRVLCVDDNADMNAAFQMMIDADPAMRCVGCLTSADRLVATVQGLSPPPHVVLLDATMPGTPPLLALSDLSAKHPGVRVIVCSGQDRAEIVEQYKAAGAWGFVSKRHEPDFIIDAVRAVAAGRHVWPDSIGG